MADETPADFFKTLRDHAAQLSELQTEVSGVKAALVGQDRKLDKLFEAINEARQRQGPGVREMLGVCALGGGLVSMVAAAITVLVVSIVQPAQARLETSHAGLLARVERQEAMAWDDLKQLRSARDERLREVEKRLSWAPTMKVN